MELECSLNIEKIKVDFKKVADINIPNLDINKYISDDGIRLSSLANDSLFNKYPDSDDIEANVSFIISFKEPIPFKKLAISFIASTYTELLVIFKDNSSIKLSGENGDYHKYNYSLNELARKLKYKNREVSKLITYGSFGEEEFNSIEILEV